MFRHVPSNPLRDAALVALLRTHYLRYQSDLRPVSRRNPLLRSPHAGALAEQRARDDQLLNLRRAVTNLPAENVAEPLLDG